MTDDGVYAVASYLSLDMIALINTDCTGWSATTAVYGDVRHILCFWHVDR